MGENATDGHMPDEQDSCMLPSHAPCRHNRYFVDQYANVHAYSCYLINMPTDYYYYYYYYYHYYYYYYF